jgi:magnesium transporter
MAEEQKSALLDHETEFAEAFETITELVSQEKYDEVAKNLSELHYADLADSLNNLNPKLYKIIIPLIIDSFKAETLIWINSSIKQSVVELLGLEKVTQLIDSLDIEDAVEVMDDIEEYLKDEILDKLNSAKRHQLLEGFTYPENVVGRILEKRFICFQEHWTVAQAIDAIKKSKFTPDSQAAIVVDNKHRPIGNISFSTILAHSRNEPLRSLLNPDFKVADTMTDISEVAFIFKQYALTIVPVVNKSGKLVGSVSIKNMIYIVEEQAEKDVMQLGGVNTQDTFYNIFNTAKFRFPWLFVNLLATYLTSIIINQFSATIAKLITLAAIMPIVASIGGNAGTQSMTVTVRAISNKDINQANARRVIFKEILVSGINGLVLAVISGSLSFMLLGEVTLCVIFAVAILLNSIIAGLLGAIIPIGLHNLHIDPATASGVFLSALTDALGFLSFLTLAYFFVV